MKCILYNLGIMSFYLPERYKPILDPIEQGAYGAVLACDDLITGRKVAIKKLKSLKYGMDLKRALREIIILKNVKHENIIQLYDVIFHKKNEIGDIYLVMEKMDSDLHKIIASNQVLSDELIQLILFQILRAFYYLHSVNIVHRDIVPSNILINEDCTVKICDFGMSRTIQNINTSITEYVTTRYYRAPEIILNSRHYNKKIDVWSIGCSFIELLIREPLFPGQDYQHLIKLIIDVLGSPSEEDMNFIASGPPKDFIQSLAGRKKKPFSSLINYPNPLAIDLIDKMIVFNPDKRVSIEEAINHPYLDNIKEGIENPIFEGNLNLDFDSKDSDITIEQLYQRLLDEIQSFDTGLIF